MLTMTLKLKAVLERYITFSCGMMQMVLLKMTEKGKELVFVAFHLHLWARR